MWRNWIYLERIKQVPCCFDLRLIQYFYRFHDDDPSSEEEYNLFRISLIGKYFFEAEWKLFFGDVDFDNEYSKDFDDEDYEVESHESLGYPPFIMEHDEIQPSNALGHKSSLSCLDQEGIFFHNLRILFQTMKSL